MFTDALRRCLFEKIGDAVFAAEFFEMKVTIDLNYYSKWAVNRDRNISVCGYSFFDRTYLDAQSMSYMLEDTTTIEDVDVLLRKANGFFSLVYNHDIWGIAAVDLIQSYPLFYIRKKNEIHISDDVRSLLKYTEYPDLSSDMEIEFLACSYALNEDTFFNAGGVKQIQPGEYLWWNGDEFGTSTYYSYGNQKIENEIDKSKKSDSEWFAEIDKVQNAVGRRLVASLNNRQAVIPLSGGFDSRAVAQMLKQQGYENVLCYTYGSADDCEVVKAQEVSKALGYPIVFVRQENRNFKQLWKDHRFAKWFNSMNNCISVPYIQHYVGAAYLIDHQLIDEDAVFMSGNSGDFLQGAHMDRTFLEKQTIQESDILQRIYNEHFMLNRHEFINNKFINLSIKRYIPEKPTYTSQEATGIIDRFNWRERQSKFVTNEVRGFEALGHEWRLPLWDKELMVFWDGVPACIKAERELYKRYKKATDTMTSVNYTDSMDVKYTVRGQIANWLKEYHPAVIKRLFYFERVRQYFFTPQHWNGLVSFHKYMQLVRKSGGGLSGWSICSVLAELQVENMKSEYYHLAKRNSS